MKADKCKLCHLVDDVQANNVSSFRFVQTGFIPVVSGFHLFRTEANKRWEAGCRVEGLLLIELHGIRLTYWRGD